MLLIPVTSLYVYVINIISSKKIHFYLKKKIFIYHYLINIIMNVQYLSYFLGYILCIFGVQFFIFLFYIYSHRILKSFPFFRTEFIHEEVERSVSRMQTVIELGRVARDRKTLPIKVFLTYTYNGYMLSSLYLELAF